MKNELIEIKNKLIQFKEESLQLQVREYKKLKDLLEKEINNFNFVVVCDSDDVYSISDSLTKIRTSMDFINNTIQIIQVHKYNFKTLIRYIDEILNS